MSPQELREAYFVRYGAYPDFMAMAPGRINLIGEHTDYNDGFVFPVAIDRVTLVAASVVPDRSILFSTEKYEARPFDANHVAPDEIDDWGKYPAGVAWVLREKGFQPKNLRALVQSSIPMGSGVSSSAALELAFLVLHRQILGLNAQGPTLAGWGKECENKFVGVNSGIMDQLASAMGRQDRAIFIDTRSLEIEYAHIPSHLSIVLCDTKKERALTDSAYNKRRSECEEAARVLEVTSLRDANLSDLESAKSRMPEVVYRRARHVISENDRTREFRNALDQADSKKIGDLMKASHQSLRDDYEVSCKELDLMAEAAWSAPGCVGARMTGAGFGGACVALVETGSLKRFVASTLESYKETVGVVGEVMVCKAVDGAHLL